MKKSLIWTTAGIAAIGFGVPAFAARGDSHNPVVPAPAVVTVATTPTEHNSVTPATVTNQTAPASLPVVSVSVPTSPASTPVSVDDANDDNATNNSVEDVNDDDTVNSVEDVSGQCDEAEHANDPRCTNPGATRTSDNNNNNNSDRGGNNDNIGHDAGDDSGHGNSNDG
jgi:hypothetical protein